MNYNQILLCYFQRKPFTSLAKQGDFKHQVFTLQMLENFLDHYIKQLSACIDLLVATGDEHRQSQLGFELGIAQILQSAVGVELHELITVEV